MKVKYKISLGIVLILCGGMAMILGSEIGFTLLRDPLRFIIGFLIGVILGAGIYFVLFGLIKIKKMN